MKKIMMIAVMAVCCLTASAQKMRHSAGDITIQPMIGFSTGYWRASDDDSSSSGNDARVGLSIGAEGEYYTSTEWLSISAGLKYEQLGWANKNIPDTKIDYINIPVLANFYVAKGFALKVGLQPGFMVSAKQDGKDIKSDFNTFNLAIPLGLSYEFKNGITLDLRGFASLTKLNKEGSGKLYNDGGSLTIGYKFELK